MDIASMCRIGGQKINKDYAAFSDEHHCACLALANAQTSPLASQMLVDSIIEDFKRSNAITTTSMSEFFDHAQSKLLKYKLKHDELSDMRASAAVMFTDGNCAVWGHIGDSRIYHFKDGLIDEITPDHTAAYALFEAGEIRYGKIAKRRNRTQLYRTMGNPDDFRPEITNPSLVKEGESFLLCTDGFWEHIGVRQTEKALKKSSSAQEWLDRMTHMVEKHIHKHGSIDRADNYTAITIKI